MQLDVPSTPLQIPLNRTRSTLQTVGHFHTRYGNMAEKKVNMFNDAEIKQSYREDTHGSAYVINDGHTLKPSLESQIRYALYAARPANTNKQPLTGIRKYNAK